MPREYIARLVLDRRHRSVAIVRKRRTVVGGITYRPFHAQARARATLEPNGGCFRVLPGPCRHVSARLRKSETSVSSGLAHF